jgi:hypothetical protein
MAGNYTVLRKWVQWMFIGGYFTKKNRWGAKDAMLVKVTFSLDKMTRLFALTCYRKALQDLMTLRIN